MTLSILESYLLYISSFILASIFATFFARSKGILKFIFLILAISGPSLVAAVRHLTVGTDYQYYVYHILEIQSKANSVSDLALLDSKFELGFNFIIYIFSSFVDYYPVIVFYIYALIALCILLALDKLVHKRYVGLGFFFYLSIFWLFAYNGLRQSMAATILFFSLYYIKKRKLWHFLLVIILAMSFHKTAIIFFPVYFLFNIKDLKREKIYLFISIIGVLFVALFLRESSSLIGMDRYLDSKYAQISEEGKIMAFLKIIQSIALLFPFFLWRDKLVKANYTNRLYYNILYLFIFVKVLSFQITIASRFAFYFEVVTIPLALQMIQLVKQRSEFINVFYIYAYFVIYKFIYIYMESGQVIPYIFMKGLFE